MTFSDDLNLQINFKQMSSKDHQAASASGGDQEMYSDEMDAISTVSLLIDDLSSEDPNAKLHSIQRLGQIAALLGADRCVDELVPMLTELIDKIDCNPELLLNLAEQLGSLTSIIDKNSSVLLTPLEMIVGSDDSVVREKAIESLKKVTEFLDPITINTKYVLLCKRLKKGDIFSMRIAASALYANVYPKLNKDN